MIIADRNIITLRNQKPNAEVFAHNCQQRSLGVLCPVVSLPTNFCLSFEIQPVLLGINTPRPEQEKAILQFLLGRDVFVALPTGYGKLVVLFFLPLVFDRVRDLSN